MCTPVHVIYQNQIIASQYLHYIVGREGDVFGGEALPLLEYTLVVIQCSANFQGVIIL